jgi:ubiquinone/menaquinone biosynthesis C-methylase UbiE
MTQLPTLPREPSAWGDYFDQYAPAYEQTAFATGGLGYVGEKEVAAVVAALRTRAPGQLLDAGAGSGRVSRALHPLGWQITAIDLSTEMLARTAADIPGTKVLRAAVGERLPFADGSFDAIVSVRVLKYVDDLELALLEFRRVLRPDGIAVIEFTNRRSAARFGYPGAPIRLVTWNEAQAALTRAGFRIAARETGTRLPQPVWRWAREGKRLRSAIAMERATGVVLGGPQSALGARSALLVGEPM